MLASFSSLRFSSVRIKLHLGASLRTEPKCITYALNYVLISDMSPVDNSKIRYAPETAVEGLSS